MVDHLPANRVIKWTPKSTCNWGQSCTFKLESLPGKQAHIWAMCFFKRYFSDLGSARCYRCGVGAARLGPLSSSADHLVQSCVRRNNLSSFHGSPRGRFWSHSHRMDRVKHFQKPNSRDSAVRTQWVCKAGLSWGHSLTCAYNWAWRMGIINHGVTWACSVNWFGAALQPH